MSHPKTNVTQTELTRGFKAWKAVYGNEPVCRIMTDGTIELAPVDREKVSGNDLTPLQKRMVRNASS